MKIYLQQLKFKTSTSVVIKPESKNNILYLYKSKNFSIRLFKQ